MMWLSLCFFLVGLATCGAAPHGYFVLEHAVNGGLLVEPIFTTVTRNPIRFSTDESYMTLTLREGQRGTDGGLEDDPLSYAGPHGIVAVFHRGKAGQDGVPTLHPFSKELRLRPYRTGSVPLKEGDLLVVILPKSLEAPFPLPKPLAAMKDDGSLYNWLNSQYGSYSIAVIILRYAEQSRSTQPSSVGEDKDFLLFSKESTISNYAFALNGGYSFNALWLSGDWHDRTAIAHVGLQAPGVASSTARKGSAIIIMRNAELLSMVSEGSFLQWRNGEDIELHSGDIIICIGPGVEELTEERLQLFLQYLTGPRSASLQTILNSFGSYISNFSLLTTSVALDKSKPAFWTRALQEASNPVTGIYKSAESEHVAIPREDGTPVCFSTRDKVHFVRSTLNFSETGNYRINMAANVRDNSSPDTKVTVTINNDNLAEISTTMDSAVLVVRDKKILTTQLQSEPVPGERRSRVALLPGDIVIAIILHNSGLSKGRLLVLFNLLATSRLAKLMNDLIVFTRTGPVHGISVYASTVIVDASNPTVRLDSISRLAPVATQAPLATPYSPVFSEPALGMRANKVQEPLHLHFSEEHFVKHLGGLLTREEHNEKELRLIDTLGDSEASLVLSTTTLARLVLKGESGCLVIRNGEPYLQRIGAAPLSHVDLQPDDIVVLVVRLWAKLTPEMFRGITKKIEDARRKHLPNILQRLEEPSTDITLIATIITDGGRKGRAETVTTSITTQGAGSDSSATSSPSSSAQDQSDRKRAREPHPDDSSERGTKKRLLRL